MQSGIQFDWMTAATVIFLLTLLSFVVGPVSAQSDCDACPDYVAEGQWTKNYYPPRDRAYDRSNLEETRPLPYDHVREGDAFWSKMVWREIDFKEKMNLPFAYPKQPFVEILLEAALNSELDIFSPLNDHDFTESLSRKSLEAKLFRVDSVPIFDLNTGEWIGDTVYYSYPDYLTFESIRIREQWIFDEETSTMVVRILGIAPMRPLVDPGTGLYLGEEVLCWINYPQARDLLAQVKAFNPFNDGITLSWDDVMEMRYFSSSIIKVSNVGDQYIEDYASGIDVALEDQRLENEIRRFESELWEY
jgi:gliding motility associated protien GldN